MMNVVIVAGGLGSRLAPLTNHIPKFFVNIGKETGFVKQIEYWTQYASSITVIVHSSYRTLVREYYNMYFGASQPELPFHVVTVDGAHGSAHAIFSSCQHLEGSPVLFTWCDVLPGEHFRPEDLVGHEAVAFTNYDHPNRYDLADRPGVKHKVPVLREDGRGGLFGVYAVAEYHPKPYTKGQDFVELLTQYSKDGVFQLPMPSIIDWGDKPKLERVRSTADAARSFNSVEIHGDLVLKRALNTQGEQLIKKEIAWYEELDRRRTLVRRPKVWVSMDRDSFVMSKVKGVPVWQHWGTLDAENRRLVLRRLFDQADRLHSIKEEFTTEIVQRDVKIEAHEKLLNRYREIAGVIDAFGPVQNVNGLYLRMSPLEIINGLYEKLAKHYQGVNTMSMIHGDLQMSNSMIDPDTLEITLIDPRGYFGQTKTYGVPEYDIAKLAYALSGYDLFNYSREFHLDHNGVHGASWGMKFKIPKPDLGGCALLMERFTEVHYLWLAVIWIGLAQYIKNDPVKSVAAHYHGLSIGQLLLQGLTPNEVFSDTQYTT
jgi:hypothetical protein